MANPAIGNTQLANLAGGILPSTLAQDGVPLLQPMQWDIDIESVKMQVSDLENKIDEAFNVNPYGSVNETPVRTATEIAARESEAQRRSTTDISKIIYDFNGIFEVCLKLLNDWGLVDKGDHDIKL